MSYILEGLKKLEQKRKQEEKPPHLLTFQGDSAEKPARSSMWPYVLVAVLLLNAGVMIWWIGSRQSTERKTPAAQSASRKSVPTVAKTIPVEQKRENKPVPAKEPQQSKAMSKPLATTAENRQKTLPFPLRKKPRSPDNPPQAQRPLPQKANRQQTGEL